MKYIRTKDGVYEINRYYEPRDYYWVKQDCDQPIGSDEIIKQADTIEELCDEFVAVDNEDIKHTQFMKPFDYYMRSLHPKDVSLYGAIWTDKGLIYVAKMNEKGELELL